MMTAANRSRRTSLGLLFALIGSPFAHADLHQGSIDYAQHDYEGAFREFKEAAELGHPGGAYALAILYQNGQGVSQSYIAAYAWASLAVREGEPKAAAIADEMRPLLSETGLRFAAEMTAPFESERLNERILPRYDLNPMPGQEPCKMDPSKVRGYYPPEAQSKGMQGQVYIEFTIAPDGRSRNAHIITAVPSKVFDQAARDAIAHAEFTPARENGKKVSCHFATMFQFVVAGLSAFDYPKLQDLVKKMKTGAEEGNTEDQLQYAFAISGFPQLQKPRSEALPWFLKAAQAGSPVAQYEIGESMLLGWGCRCEEQKGSLWLLQAAAAGEIDAQVALALDALQRGASGSELTQIAGWLDRGALANNADAEFYLAALLATARDAEHRDPKRALTLLKHAETTRRGDPLVAEISAAARAGLGDYSGAEKDERAAIVAAQALHWDIGALQDRLTRYRAREPWGGNIFEF